MKIKDSLGVKIFQVVNYIILSLLVVVTLYPIVHVFMASFSNGNDLMAHTGPLLWPLRPNVQAFKLVFEDGQLFRSYGNTLYICVVSLVINMIMTAFGAYFLTRKEAIGRGVIMALIMVTMYFGGGLIPSYLVVQTLGLYNTYWALILPGAIGTYNMIVLRTAFAAIPESLYEAARIDGAGHFRILSQLMVPLAKASLAVITLYYLVGHWNSWFGASIYLEDKERYPLQLFLREILIKNDTTSMTADIGLGEETAAASEALKYAIIVVSVVPVLCVYPFLQKYFAKGVMVGAVKG